MFCSFRNLFASYDRNEFGSVACYKYEDAAPRYAAAFQSAVDSGSAEVERFEEGYVLHHGGGAWRRWHFVVETEASMGAKFGEIPTRGLLFVQSKNADHWSAFEIRHQDLGDLMKIVYESVLARCARNFLKDENHLPGFVGRLDDSGAFSLWAESGTEVFKLYWSRDFASSCVAINRSLCDSVYLEERGILPRVRTFTVPQGTDEDPTPPFGEYPEWMEALEVKYS